MTTPRAQTRPRYASHDNAGRPYRPRAAIAAWGPYKRLRDGIDRQWLLGLAIAAIVCAAGLVVARVQGRLFEDALIFWSGIGACAGFAVAVARELGRATITSVASMGEHRGYAVLGAAPAVTSAELRDLQPDQRTPLGCLAFQPASPFATAMRDLQGALASESLIAFISPSPYDDAASIAMCAAASAAQQGRRTIVIDCDWRWRGLTYELGVEPDQGVYEAMESEEAWLNVVGQEPETGLHYIPAMRARRGQEPLALTPEFQALVGRLRAVHDLVVLHCPPASARADGVELAAMADKVVIVAAWDQTPVSSLKRLVRTLRPRVRAPLGVFVSRVPAGRRFGRLRPG